MGEKNRVEKTGVEKTEGEKTGGGEGPGGKDQGGKDRWEKTEGESTGHYSKYVRSLFDMSYFYEIKAIINFLRWGGSAPPDPAFLQCHREPNGLTSEYTKLKTN